MEQLQKATSVDMEISLEKPLEDYNNLIKTRLLKPEATERMPDDVIFGKIFDEGRKVFWKLLFERDQRPGALQSEDELKAAALLKQMREDASFHMPAEYNSWIVKVRDELLKREMFGFWRDVLVKQELGPLWAKDCDFFDDRNDKEPEAFYKYAGSVAPFSKEAKTITTPPSAQHTEALDAKPGASVMQGAHISLEHPLEDYEKLVKTYMQCDYFVDDQVLQENQNLIFAEARNVIWKLLFNSEIPNDEHVKNAGAMLKAYKQDACFYSPWPYNEWIVRLRDEVLKREMLNFWCDVMVKGELGPCWARDSDLFEDMEDPAPAEFYKRAGCVAPFEKVTNTGGGPILHEAKISLVTPVEDYQQLVKDILLSDFIVSDEVHQENQAKIFSEVRRVLWALLFDKSPAQPQDLENAGKLLVLYKQDACFYSPWDYNDWIVTVRDELLKRNMLDFWRDVVVKKELGPCWAKDSDLFEDMEDPAPAEFYKHAGCRAPFTKEPAN